MSDWDRETRRHQAEWGFRRTAPKPPYRRGVVEAAALAVELEELEDDEA